MHICPQIDLKLTKLQQKRTEKIFPCGLQHLIIINFIWGKKYKSEDGEFEIEMMGDLKFVFLPPRQEYEFQI